MNFLWSENPPGLRQIGGRRGSRGTGDAAQRGNSTAHRANAAGAVRRAGAPGRRGRACGWNAPGTSISTTTWACRRIVRGADAGFLHRNLLTPAGGTGAAGSGYLRGDAPDSAAECAAYDQCITSRGGIDLAILGLGVNGHCAFKEPGSDWRGATRVVDLDDQTRRAHRERTGGRYPIPEQGLTMGIGTLRAARRILLLVSGQPKRRAFEALLRGVPDPAWPVTSLLGHPALRVVAECALRPRARAGVSELDGLPRLRRNRCQAEGKRFGDKRHAKPCDRRIERGIAHAGH